MSRAVDIALPSADEQVSNGDGLDTFAPIGSIARQIVEAIARARFLEPPLAHAARPGCEGSGLALEVEPLPSLHAGDSGPSTGHADALISPAPAAMRAMSS